MRGRIRSKLWKKRKMKETSMLYHAFQNYCEHTSLHGLRYVVDPKLHWLGRLVWLVIITVFAFVASNVIYTLSYRFQEAPTSIGIASTNYEISAVPFPSITFCPNDRVDWEKALDLEKRLFADSADPQTIKTFRDILLKLSSMTFGDFDDLSFLRKRNLDGLLGLNVSQILREVLPTCEDLFSACWWRNANRNCCEIFELQRTEFGFCYSFNSELAERSTGVLPEEERTTPKEERPRRASGYGEWSGVKVTIHLGNVTQPPDSEEIRGVVLIVSEPRVWPNSGNMIPEGSLVSVSIDCVSGFATQPVLELDEKRTPCRHGGHSAVYNQETCLSLCKRAHVIKYCGCYPSYLFPTSSARECNVQDFLCLVEHNDVFNDYYVLTADGRRDQNAMVCGCPPECEYYIYNPLYSTVPLKDSQDIMVDVHFVGQTGLRYKTDIVITDLDLLVSFGGIMGLFLGGSLLSAAELIYYLMLALFSHLRLFVRLCFRSEEPVASAKSVKRGGPPNARTFLTTAHPSTAIAPLPILDYAPVKPKSTRIPIFLNYSPVKSHYHRY